MFEETHERRVEGLIACPEFGKGEDALPADFLHKPALGEYDGQYVSESRQGDEDREYAFSAGTEHVAEKLSSDDAARCNDVFFGYRSEIGYIDEHVEDRDEDQGSRCGSF